MLYDPRRIPPQSFPDQSACYSPDYASVSGSGESRKAYESTVWAGDFPATYSISRAKSTDVGIIIPFTLPSHLEPEW